MTIEKLTEYIATATQTAAQKLEQENMRLFKDFFVEVDSANGTKQLKPKTITIELTSKDDITGATNIQLKEVALISLVSNHFLELKNVSFLFKAANNQDEQLAIPILQQQKAFNNLIDEYAKQLVNL